MNELESLVVSQSQESKGNSSTIWKLTQNTATAVQDNLFQGFMFFSLLLDDGIGGIAILFRTLLRGLRDRKSVV